MARRMTLNPLSVAGRLLGTEPAAQRELVKYGSLAEAQEQLAAAVNRQAPLEPVLGAEVRASPPATEAFIPARVRDVLAWERQAGVRPTLHEIQAGDERVWVINSGDTFELRSARGEPLAWGQVPTAGAHVAPEAEGVLRWW